MPQVAASPVVEIPKVFAPPPVEVGQIVLWTHGPGPGEVPCPAIVRRVGNTALNVSLIEADSRTLSPRTGVRHVDDPFLATMPEHSAGCWRLSPRDLRINALLDSFGHSEEE